MQKRCKCGSMMNMHLSTVVYSKIVQIENVPVLSCCECNKSELFHGIKTEVLELLEELGNKPQTQRIAFDEYNEFARFISCALDESHEAMQLGHWLEEWINQLLDLLNIARSLHDEAWQEDIHKRLSQITGYLHYTAEPQIIGG